MPFPALILVFLGSASHDAAPDASRGEALLKGCQAEMRLLQPGAVASAPQSDLVNGSYCIGYVNGFLAGLAPATASVCTEQAPMISVVGAYVHYMEQNPQLLTEDKRVGLRQALQAAFPCPTAGTGIDLHIGSAHQNRL